MSAAEGDDAQSAYGDGAGGPGAPTPLSALEVNSLFFASNEQANVTM